MHWHWTWTRVVTQEWTARHVAGALFYFIWWLDRRSNELIERSERLISDKHYAEKEQLRMVFLKLCRPDAQFPAEASSGTMKTPLQFCFILISMQFSVIGIFASNIVNKDYPCPLDDEFSPCICTENEELTLDVDCSSAKTEEELFTAFSRAVFPFTNMDSLLIDHSSCDDCALVILKADTFGPVGFRIVQIHGTAIATIEEGAFANSDYLEVWDLSGNNISSFTFEVVETFPALETLNLNDNAIDGSTTVPDITSSSLKNLYLSNNPEVVFGPNFVHNCPELEDLQLSNISLEEIPQISQDTTSMFDGLTQLKNLDLSNNPLIRLESNSINPGVDSYLTDVNLSSCSIEVLLPEFVANQGATGSLDMSDNQIALLLETVWQPIFHSLGPEAINLQNNPLLCGCEMAWLVLDPELMAILDPGTTCSDGVTLVVELQPGPFENCEQHL